MEPNFGAFVAITGLGSCIAERPAGTATAAAASRASRGAQRLMSFSLRVGLARGCSSGHGGAATLWTESSRNVQQQGVGSPAVANPLLKVFTATHRNIYRLTGGKLGGKLGKAPV